MRRYGLVVAVAVLAILLVGSLLVGVLLEPGRRPETWETALQRHLAFKSLTSGDSWQVTLDEQATSPTRFDRAMSRVSYGTGTHYQLQVVYQAMTPTPTGTRMIRQAATPTPTGAGFAALSGGRPLPYPPDEVWCVLLTQGPSGDTRELLVYVALHMDLYSAEWVVHEAETTPFSDEVLDGLWAIGCDEVGAVVDR